jgi:hypothetical protein
VSDENSDPWDANDVQEAVLAWKRDEYTPCHEDVEINMTMMTTTIGQE